MTTTTQTAKKESTAKKTTQRNAKPRQTRSTTKKLNFNERLALVIEDARKKSNKVDINGVDYSTVRTRKYLLRKEFGFDVKILTILKEHDNSFSFALFEAQIKVLHEGTKEWETVANGYAYEIRASSELNLHNFIENAETSAIGRALSNLGVDGDSISEAELKKQSQAPAKNNKSSSYKKSENTKKLGGIKESQIKEIEKLVKELEHNVEDILKEYKVSKIEDLNQEQALKIIDVLKAGLEDDLL